MRASAVLLRPTAGMQDQPPGRVSVEQLQQGGPFLRAFHAKPGLEGHGNRRFFENSVQKTLQLLRVGQQPRAPVLAHHRAGGAAQIDVDLLVAQRFQLVRRPEKVLAAVGQDLGHGLHTGVILRQNVRLLPMGQRLAPGAPKGQKIFVRPIETGVLGAAVQPVRNPLHRGE